SCEEALPALRALFAPIASLHRLAHRVGQRPRLPFLSREGTSPSEAARTASTAHSACPLFETVKAMAKTG
ncbi:MAG TPA: hypothetical protein PLL12_07130, partial [Aestuariivirga sp.]|nr:hypothetical protein [Aestuariivirga sp.]